MNTKSGAEEPDTKFVFKGAPLLASVPAALASALVGSRLGVQGTLIGAAITAVVFGVVSQFATFGFQRTHAGLKVAVGRRSPDEGSDADPTSPEQQVPADASPTNKGRRRVHVGIALAGMAATALATFVVSMTFLTAVETAAGRSVDGGYTSTVGGAAKGAAAAAPTSEAPQADEASVTAGRPLETASLTPSAPAPTSGSPTASAAPTPAATPSATSQNAAIPVPQPSSTPDAVDTPAAVGTPTGVAA